MSLLRRRPRWTIVTSAPNTDGALQWGDTWFARDLAEALESSGVQARVVTRGGGTHADRERDDVVVVLRGLTRIVPRRPRRGGACWILWVISHPELVTPEEMEQYDVVFAASPTWGGGAARPLLQATNPRRFRPDAGAPDSGADVLFVGSTRGQFRPAVRAAVAADVPIQVHGVGWQEYLPPERIAGEFLPNDRLPQAYASAGVVLNDHWPQMAQEGFLSNRLFDAAATGTRVLSDEAVGLREVFGDVVVTWDSEDVLVATLRAPREEVFASREARRDLADRIAREHSFDARAAILREAAVRDAGA